ncbi:MAG: hypothetical protein P4N60_09630 [Verrucomicrobiae bacterium]|nr:hypothetical protein [Verrucomicrobiae bacterium]
MTRNPLEKDGLKAKATGSVMVTPKMVRDRAEALAVMKGRDARDVTEADLARARRELTNQAIAKV